MQTKLLLVNAYGPYVHGVWRSDAGSIGNEESLGGRGRTIVTAFVETVKRMYTDQEISSLTLCDIGCYDGWILCEIEKQLKFKTIVGYEPRRKNIRRGEVVRDYLNIKTEVKFIESSLEEVFISGNKYDIVLFPGVIHHLENLPEAIHQILNIANKEIFIEGNCFESNDGLARLLGRKSGDIFDDIINPKDVVCNNVQGKALRSALAGYKLESAYYDGSTIGTGIQVVTIASPEYLQMLLYAKGATNIEVIKSPEEYRQSMKNFSLGTSRRFINYRFTLIHASIPPGNKEKVLITSGAVDAAIETTEEIYLKTILPKDLLHALTCARKIRGPVGYAIKLSIEGNRKRNKLARRLVASIFGLDSDQQQVFNTFFHCANHKLALEMLKLNIAEGRLLEAKNYLISILYSETSDWRCVYRSLVLWMLVDSNISFNDPNIVIEDLLELSNPRFPKKIIQEIKDIKEPGIFFGLKHK